MAHRLPPLNALRAFEAAGRALSFTKAAAELTVTQAAISHQVKALETHLGQALFERRPRQLLLTRAGRALLPVVRDAFERIDGATQALKDDAVGARLTVRLAPSFAAHWLSPRLEDFLRNCPDIELSLKLSNAPADFTADEVDVAVTYGDGSWPGLVADPVLSLDFFPVCSPSLLQGESGLETPDDIGQFTLLHDGDRKNWRAWLKIAGCEGIDASHGTVVDDTNVLMQAAMDGVGIALGSSVYVAEYIESRRLVKPFDIALYTDNAYHVVCPKRYLERREVRVFRDWLLSHADS